MTRESKQSPSDAWPLLKGEAGELAFADLNTGEKCVLLLRHGNTWLTVYTSSAVRGVYLDCDVRNVRPAVVLDPAGLDGVADWIEHARVVADVPDSVPLAIRLIRVEDAIRAATDKLRMSEPGWGEKVTAHTELKPNRRRFLRVRDYRAERLVWADESGSAYQWGELIDPEPAS